MSVPIAALRRICEAAGIPADRVISLQADRRRVRFMVASVDSVGSGFYRRPLDNELQTHWVDVAVSGA